MDIKVTDGTVLETLNNKVDLDGGNYVGSPLEQYIHKHSMTDNITNCITEIPQRIKYTLEDGTLTIKAGSVVIVPYGTEDLTAQYPVGATFLNDNFKVYDTQYTEDADGNGKFFVWAELVNTLSLTISAASSTGQRVILLKLETGKLTTNYADRNIFSGSEVIETGLYYRTDLNNVEHYNTELVKDYSSCLPLLIVSVTAGETTVTSIDQVFNGFGYIGTTVWVDKGVKGLIPNGRNEDGTLKNISAQTTKLRMLSGLAASNTSWVLWTSFDLGDIGFRNAVASSVYLQDAKPTVPSTTKYAHWYSPSENIVRFMDDGVTWEETKHAIFGSYRSIDGVVYDFKTKQSFRAADEQDVVKRTGDVITGMITFEHKSNNNGNNSNYSGFVVRDNGYTKDNTEIPTAERRIGGISVIDANNNTCFDVRTYKNINNQVAGAMNVSRIINGTNYTSYVRVYVDSTGQALIDFPKCTTKATTTSSAKSMLPAVITQNYVSGTSWYRVWSDGWIEQGGQTNVAANTTATVNLIKTMSTTSYFLTGTNLTYFNKDKWSITPYMKRVSVSQIQIGNVEDAQQTFGWMVCGY